MSFRHLVYNNTGISSIGQVVEKRNYITFEVTGAEKDVLKEYCQIEGRTQTDVLRAYVRSLKRKLRKTEPKGSSNSSYD